MINDEVQLALHPAWWSRLYLCKPQISHGYLRFKTESVSFEMEVINNFAERGQDWPVGDSGEETSNY